MKYITQYIVAFTLILLFSTQAYASEGYKVKFKIFPERDSIENSSATENAFNDFFESVVLTGSAGVLNGSGSKQLNTISRDGSCTGSSSYSSQAKYSTDSNQINGNFSMKLAISCTVNSTSKVTKYTIMGSGTIAPYGNIKNIAEVRVNNTLTIEQNKDGVPISQTSQKSDTTLLKYEVVPLATSAVDPALKPMVKSSDDIVKTEASSKIKGKSLAEGAKNLSEAGTTTHNPSEIPKKVGFFQK